MKRILVAVPSCCELVNIHCIQSVYNIKVPEGYSIKIHYISGYSVSQARNKASLIAIDEGYDYILYVDSDQIVPEDTLEKLLKCNKDISGGWSLTNINSNLDSKPNIYKYDKVRNYYDLCDIKDIQSGIIEVDAIGFACVLIRTEILRSLNYPYFVFTEYSNRGSFSEDLYFCHIAKQNNFSILCDTSLRVGHLKSINI